MLNYQRVYLTTNIWTSGQYLYILDICESEVVTWIMPVFSDYVRQLLVDGNEMGQRRDMKLFSRTYAVMGS